MQKDQHYYQNYNLIFIYALNNKLVCAALFADLPMAFDTVDHGFLLRTVCKIGMDTTACKFFHSYLNGRH